jgi:hypothetical protein
VAYHVPPPETGYASLAGFDLPTRGRLSRVGRHIHIAAAALLLAACQTAPKGYVLLHANQAPVNAAKHIAQKVGDCWFDSGNSRFADYSYAPELSSSERPRVLVVNESDPAGLPQLVIEVVREKRGSDIRLFGPLMDGGEAERIRDDVAFWAGGGRTCR